MVPHAEEAAAIQWVGAEVIAWEAEAEEHSIPIAEAEEAITGLSMEEV